MVNRRQIVILLALVLLVGSLLTGCGGATEGTAEWHFDQGNKLYGQGRYDEAIKEYSKAIRLNPELAEAYYNRGLTYKKLGQLERAIEDYNAAIRLNPELAES